MGQSKNVNPLELSIAKCWECDEIVKIKTDNTMFVCPSCGFKNLRPHGVIPFNDQKKDFLIRLANFEAIGFTHVSWLSPGDKATCTMCKERNGKVFTIAEMRSILSSRFCQSNGFDQTCRCCIITVREPILKKPKTVVKAKIVKE